MVVQWVAGTEAEYKLIARTFLSVFPNTTVWREGGVLIGTVEPLRLSGRISSGNCRCQDARRALETSARTASRSSRGSIPPGPDELREFVGPGPILTDDRPMVEYFLSLPRDRDPDFSKLKKGDFNRLVAVNRSVNIQAETAELAEN